MSAFKLLEKRTVVVTTHRGTIPWIIGHPLGFYRITIPGYPEIIMQPPMLISMSSLIVVVHVRIANLRF